MSDKEDLAMAPQVAISES